MSGEQGTAVRSLARQRRAGRSRSRRRGVVLLWVIVFLFVLLTLASLVVDGGLALVTRRQLQTAAGVAALEGVRRPESLTDLEHRQAVVDLVDQLFDDSLNRVGEAEESDDITFGAGPVWEYTGGVALPGTSFRVGPRNEPSSPGYYQPHLATNVGNELEGDLVRGAYDRSQSDHHEADDYGREDFTAQETGPAFLARVRRTGESLSPVAGTSGPRLHYLFGRAPGGNTTSWYDERERGMAIRGTAIADLEPVQVVGPAYPRTMYLHRGAFPDDLDLTGLAPWAVRLEEWNAGEIRLNVADLSLTSVVRMIGVSRLSGGVSASDTQLTLVSADGFPGAASVPFVVRLGDELLLVTEISGGTDWTVERGYRSTQPAAHAGSSLVTRMAPLVMGTLLDPNEPLDWQAAAAGTRPPDGSGIVAVFASRAAFGERVVGFSRASWRTDGEELVVTPAADQVTGASTSASAHFPSRLPSGVSSSTISALMAAQREIAQPLRAAVFVRAIE